VTTAACGTGTASTSDAVLMGAVRDGDVAAYGALYARYLPAARRAAASLATNSAEREDLVAEGFARVLRILRSGGGPDEEFRPYLLTTLRNTLISWRRRDAHLSLVADVPETALRAGLDDPVANRLHATMAAEAFAGLPERWQTVLWHTEVEGESPAEIAKRLGMTPNGVAALAYRARQGLRQAYLAQYVPATEPRTCKAVATQLAGWIRHGGTTLKTQRIAAHLARCADCRELADSLRQVNQELNPGPSTVRN
jgi:RNA polymerase sigma factor (sigma-70 family)